MFAGKALDLPKWSIIKLSLLLALSTNIRLASASDKHSSFFCNTFSNDEIDFNNAYTFQGNFLGSGYLLPTQTKSPANWCGL
jgi:hypothetical protein